MSGIAACAAFVCLSLGLTLGACDKPERPAKAVDPYSSEGLRARYGTDLGLKDAGISYYTRLTDTDPCHSGNAIKLADELLKVRAHAATVKFVTDTLAKCPPSRNLQWKRLAGNKALERWDEALVDADALVKDAPTDSDFWWWRGEIHEEKGNFAQALVDHQQSLALSTTVYPARRLLRMPEKAKGFQCPAAFAIHRYIAASDNDRESWGAGARDLYLAGACDGAAGRGNLALTQPRGAEIARIEVTLGKPTTDAAGNAAPAPRAELVWNPALGVTVLSKAFAARAGVPLAGSPVRVYVNGAHLDATLVELDLEVSLAQVPKLPVAIVEQVPGGGDGVLGGDFTWRFKRNDEGDGVSLSSWR